MIAIFHPKEDNNSGKLRIPLWKDHTSKSFPIKPDHRLNNRCIILLNRETWIIHQPMHIFKELQVNNKPRRCLKWLGHIRIINSKSLWNHYTKWREWGIQKKDERTLLLLVQILDHNNYLVEIRHRLHLIKQTIPQDQ